MKETETLDGMKLRLAFLEDVVDEFMRYNRTAKRIGGIQYPMDMIKSTREQINNLRRVITKKQAVEELRDGCLEDKAVIFSCEEFEVIKNFIEEEIHVIFDERSRIPRPELKAFGFRATRQRTLWRRKLNGEGMRAAEMLISRRGKMTREQ